MLKPHILNLFSAFFLALLFFIGGCASHKKNIFSKTFHNTTARYNAYYIANEDIREVEMAIVSSHKNNYNKILGVFHDIDSSTINGVRTQLDDAIVKASLSIQRHENSDWVYPSYFLVGKARYYGGDFVNAIETFKYINKHSENKDIRHQSLIALMRSFIDYDEHNNAVAVADYLRKENLNKENMRDFLLTKTYLFQIREDYDNMVRNLSQAVEIETKKQKKARYYFILGQVYQHLGFEGEAYNNYKKCLKSNPDYELSFYSKLNLARVTKLDQKVDLKKIRGYFKKLLKDDKNRDFVDRIYYEMAIFEIKHNDPDMAIEYLKSSLEASNNNPLQQGYSYLKLGELYYDLYKNYELAQAYYDSTVSVLPKDEERFEEIKLRSEILTDFVEQHQIIHLQDSLLALSEMDQDKLQQLLDGVVAEEERLEKQRNKETRKLKRQTTSAGSGTMPGGAYANPFGIDASSPSEGGDWYFYNLSNISTGRTQFLSKWGNRSLEDNWRVSQKRSSGFSEENVVETQDTTKLPKIDEQEILPETEDRTVALAANIPFSDEAKEQSLKKIEDAYFKLGGIYNFQLNEEINAIETFEKLLERFPGSAYEPETLYLLYLICKSSDGPKSEGYKQKLIEKYPTSIFAKLAINPNYKEESNETAQRLERLYKIAYEYYIQQEFNQARLLVSRGLQQYPDNEFSDKLKILGILIDGKIEGQYKYQYELQQFIENNPDSEYFEYANNLLAVSKEFKNKELLREGAKYFTYFDQPHFFIFVYPSLEGFTEIIPATIEQFIETKYPGQNLKTGNLSLNEGFSIVLINKFQTKEKAMNFYEDFNKSDIMLPQNENITFEKFVITEDNFQILYQTKKTIDYINFFNKNYLLQEDESN